MKNLPSSANISCVISKCVCLYTEPDGRTYYYATSTASDVKCITHFSGTSHSKWLPSLAANLSSFYAQRSSFWRYLANHYRGEESRFALPTARIHIRMIGQSRLKIKNLILFYGSGPSTYVLLYWKQPPWSQMSENWTIYRSDKDQHPDT